MINDSGEWNLSTVSISLLQMNVLLSMAIAAFLSSPLPDKFGRKPVICTSAVLITVFGLLCAHSKSYWELFVWRFLVGGSCGLMFSSAVVYLVSLKFRVSLLATRKKLFTVTLQKLRLYRTKMVI